MNHFNIHTQKWSGGSETMTSIVVSNSQFNPVYQRTNLSAKLKNIPDSKYEHVSQKISKI